MTDSLAVTLERAIAALREVEDGLAGDAILETRRSELGEIVISGNRAGLLHFARLTLQTANAQVLGHHQHLDAVNLEVCEAPLIIRLDR